MAIALVALAAILPAATHAAVASSSVASSSTGATGSALGLALQARGLPGLPQVWLRAPSLRDAVGDFYSTVTGVRLSQATTATAMQQLSPLSAAYRAGLATVMASMADAQRLRTRAYSLVSPPQIAFAERVALQALFNPARVRPVDAIAARAIVDRIDMASMGQAAAIMHEAARSSALSFSRADAPDEEIDLPYDAVTIGTAGDETYTRDKQLLIDPAGNDTYLNNAGGLLSSQMADSSGGCVSGGGTTGYASPNLTCTPLPPQACTYDIANNATGRDDLPVAGLPNHDLPGSGNGRDGSCGNQQRQDALIADTKDIGNDGDSRGVAALLDLSGSDTYTAPWAYEDKLFALIKFCYPNDTTKENTNRDIFQAGSLSGISLLWDSGSGDNTFRGRLNVQGSGHVGGIGMLFSTGGGNDLYWADRLAQGNGIAGGIGVLADTGGTNTYLLEPPVVYRNEFRPGGRECSQEGRAGQGQGGFGGVGVLWNEGEATYRAVTHSTQTAAPFAAMLDGSGSPVLFAGTDAQGSGESAPINGTPGGIVAGIGIVVDHGGAGDVCAGAGKLSGASHITKSPGAVDTSCGQFNTAAEISVADIGDAVEHLTGGAVGLRVVVNP